MLLVLVGVREVARVAPHGRAQRIGRALVLPVLVLLALFVIISVARVVQILTSTA
jgi:hypothetical protein